MGNSEQASKEASQVPNNPKPNCNVPDCERTADSPQTDDEKRDGIAPGCGYYRQRANDFAKNNPGQDPPSYYLNYGEKYCNKFTWETSSKLSWPGQQWLKSVKCGLQQGIDDLIKENPGIENDSKKFSDAAFDMHSRIYEKNGFASFDDLPISDQWSIFKTAAGEFVPFSGNAWNTWGQAVQVAPGAALEKFNEYVNPFGATPAW